MSNLTYKERMTVQLMRNKKADLIGAKLREKYGC